MLCLVGDVSGTRELFRISSTSTGTNQGNGDIKAEENNNRHTLKTLTFRTRLLKKSSDFVLLVR